MWYNRLYYRMVSNEHKFLFGKNSKLMNYIVIQWSRVNPWQDYSVTRLCCHGFLKYGLYHKNRSSCVWNEFFFAAPTHAWYKVCMFLLLLTNRFYLNSLEKKIHDLRLILTIPGFRSNKEVTVFVTSMYFLNSQLPKSTLIHIYYIM